MESDNKKVIDKRSIKLEHIMQKDYIPFLGGRPERVRIIGEDDVTNVSILVNTTHSVDDFINLI